MSSKGIKPFEKILGSFNRAFIVSFTLYMWSTVANQTTVHREIYDIPHIYQQNNLYVNDLIRYLTIFSQRSNHRFMLLYYLTFTTIISSVACFTFTSPQDALSVPIATHGASFCHLKRHRCKELNILRITKIVIQWYEPVSFRHIQRYVLCNKTLKYRKKLNIGTNYSKSRQIYLIRNINGLTLYTLWFTFKALAVREDDPLSASFNPLITSMRS